MDLVKNLLKRHLGVIMVVSQDDVLTHGIYHGHVEKGLKSKKHELSVVMKDGVYLANIYDIEKYKCRILNVVSRSEHN